MNHRKTRQGKVTGRGLLFFRVLFLPVHEGIGTSWDKRKDFFFFIHPLSFLKLLCCAAGNHSAGGSQLGFPGHLPSLFMSSCMNFRGQAVLEAMWAHVVFIPCLSFWSLPEDKSWPRNNFINSCFFPIFSDQENEIKYKARKVRVNFTNSLLCHRFIVGERCCPQSPLCR